MDNTGRNTTGGNNSKKRDRVCMELAGHTHGVSDVAWARDSRLLASASDDKSVRLWDTETVRFSYVLFLIYVFRLGCLWSVVYYSNVHLPPKNARARR